MRSAPGLEGLNWDGKVFRLNEHVGQVSLIVFGYTYCPDVCPMTLVTLKKTVENLGSLSSRVQVVFVSVDPERDSIEKLARYIPNFNRIFRR